MDPEHEATLGAEIKDDKKIHIPIWHAPISDDEDEEEQYNVDAAWEMLLNLRSCQQVMVNERTQKALNIQVGVNVSQEFPWKQIKYRELRANVFDEIENSSVLYDVFQGFEPDYHVLVGYAPILTQNAEDIPEGDPFVMFSNPDDARTALSIIRNIEAYERWKLHKRLVKKPRRWVSLKSEDEVDMTLQQRYEDSVHVEIQSVYPTTIPADKQFKYRRTEDVRDGYVELLPGELKFDMITKRRVHMAIMAGRARVDLEQQTDPTFPTNAVAQYLYEIKEGDEVLDASEDERDEAMERQSTAPPPKPATPLPAEEQIKPPPEVSDQIKLLLETLEFNQVDMYRNDYPLISEQKVEHYSNPYLEETLCFANISKSFQRFVCASDWYPTIAGLIVTAYTFSTPVTIDLISQRVDTVQRAVLQPNPILMWSFSDNLNYKLEFESPLEVTALSFCPYMPHLLFGGSKNGQLILWDLQNRAENLDYQEILTAAQNRYRMMIADFLKWTIPINEDSTISPTTITGLEVSQKAAITGIYWMSKHNYVNSYGKVYTDPEPSANNKYFLTSAIDGTVYFWNLDATGEKKVPGGLGSAKDQPEALTQNESYFKGKVFKPIFIIAFNEPITATVSDTVVFSCVVREPAKKRKNKLNFKTDLLANDSGNMRQSLIISSFYGRIERLDWLGLYADADGREIVNKASADYARVHDGPVVAMKKNPFHTNIFAAIGRNVLSVWKEDYNYSPIFWRKRPCDLTAVAWSEDRPAVLFITRIDGCLEAWDILARDDDACLSDILGGGIITAISEHRPSEPEKLLGIGDYNSSFRMVKLPHSFYIRIPNEYQKVAEYIEKEESRKKAIQSWEQKYYEKNRDVIEAKRQAELETVKEMERIEKEIALKSARKAIEEAELKAKAAQVPTHQTYTEKMKRKWDELNLNRLMNILMSRKRVDAEQLERETALEKRRLAYEAAKRESLYQTLQRVGEEVAAIRARILPAEKPDLLRQDMIDSAVTKLMANVESFQEIELEANEILDGFLDFDDIDYIHFLHRGEQRRKILNKSLGGNTERWFWYDTMKDDNMLNECNWGYEQFLSANAESTVNHVPSVVSLGLDDEILSEEIPIPEDY